MRRKRALGMMLLGVVLITRFSADSAGGQTPDRSETAKRFIGTWRLVSVEGGTPQAATLKSSLWRGGSRSRIPSGIG